jgi:hypothetical protein
LRYNSHEAVRQSIPSLKYRPQLDYKFAAPSGDKIVLKNKSELRKTPGSTKSKSASSQERLPTQTEQNLLYFSKGDKNREETELATPLMMKNLAATLDPRDFHRNLELAEQPNTLVPQRISGSLERVPVLDDQPIYNNYIKSKTNKQRVDAYKPEDLRKTKNVKSNSQQPAQNPTWYNSMKPA